MNIFGFKMYFIFIYRVTYVIGSYFYGPKYKFLMTYSGIKIVKDI